MLNGETCPKKQIKQCREADGAKTVSDALHWFEEELGQEVSAGTHKKGALVPWGGDVARATDTRGMRVGARAPALALQLSPPSRHIHQGARIGSAWPVTVSCVDGKGLW